mmetsp:Transcript_28613/g.52049  ORF Transcript_28613/g.52049 Transcript_28613/m.52049 type:complete len:172 (+) Transcript_28613:44-559(+)
MAWFPDPGIYPSADGWVPPALPSKDDMMNFEDDLKAFPKKALLKRTLVVRQRQFDGLSRGEFMEENKFSMSCRPLVPWSALSGDGEDKGHLVSVYYERPNEQTVLTALLSVGVDASDVASEPVDPNSQIEEEARMMFLQDQSLFISQWEHELAFDNNEVTKPPNARYTGWK